MLPSGACESSLRRVPTFTEAMNPETPPSCPISGRAPGAADGWHDAKLDFSKSMSYTDYLQLDTVLSAQRPLSAEHDEMLFIVQHHVSELWMKLALHELGAALACVKADELAPAFKMLSRLKRIFEQIVESWAVLTTLTPSDYSLMRPSLGSSSGFQSYQYREIEFRLGNKNAKMLQPHAHRPELIERLEPVLRAPSLYDEAVFLLARRGFEIAPQRLQRDWALATEHDASVEAAWLAVYREPRRYWDLYQLAEDLVDIEDRFRQWRFRHVTTVERIIGFKTGTGGTSGAMYLRKMLDVVLFPELWQLRTQL